MGILKIDEEMIRKYGRNYDEKELIFSEGEKGATMFFIVNGKIKIFKKIRDIEKILMILEPGDFFGEMAILENSPRSASASAVVDSTLLAFNREGFISLLKHNPNIALNMMHKISNRIKHVDIMIKDLKVRDNKTLVITSLLDVAKLLDNKTKGRIRLEYIRTIKEIQLQTELRDKDIEEVLMSLQNIGLIDFPSDQFVEIVHLDELKKMENLLRTTDNSHKKTIRSLYIEQYQNVSE